jgi:hypothetical protein
MPMVDTTRAGFYAGRIGSTDRGYPVYLYFDPASQQFRPVIVPPFGRPQYAPTDVTIRHDSDRISPLGSAVVLGAIGAMLGGGPGAALGAATGLAVSSLLAKHVRNSQA